MSELVSTGKGPLTGSGPHRVDFDFKEKKICPFCGHEVALHGRQGCRAERLSLSSFRNMPVLAVCHCDRSYASSERMLQPRTKKRIIMATGDSPSSVKGEGDSANVLLSMSHVNRKLLTSELAKTHNSKTCIQCKTNIIQDDARAQRARVPNPLTSGKNIFSRNNRH